MENQFSVEEKIRLLCGKGSWHTQDLLGKLPSLYMTDGPHGLRKEKAEGLGQNDQSIPATCFPTASAIACSWDPSAAARMARAIGEEAKAENVDIVLGPGVNIKRSPLCGRNFEYYSEDPFLSGKMGTAYIQAMQADGIGTSLKHFAGNSQETHRQTANSEIDPRALREIYLSAFEMAVKEAAPETIMASYNRLNGKHACTNKELLTDILRKEWGFQGAVISDWGAVTDIVSCIRAGMDLEMPDSDGIHTRKLIEAYQNGLVSEADIEKAFVHIQGLTLLHHPEKHAPLSPAATEKDNPTNNGSSFLPDSHHALAATLCSESAVLLQNDGFLPLPVETTPTVVVIGELAVHMRYQGGGSSHINATHTPNAVESLRTAGYHVLYAQGYMNRIEKPSVKLEKEALILAKQGYPILFFGGLTERTEGEGYDRSSLSLPQNQIVLYEKIRQINPDIAFISFGGSAMDLGFTQTARSILHMYLGGQGVADACADLISGKKNPEGKLAETFPLSLTDVPSYHYFGKNSDDVEYRESIYVGYRYYETFHKQVLFPFGHGLTYTEFTYSDIKTDITDYSGGNLNVSVKVRNSGSVSGSEVVQVYIENPPCDYLRPVRELRGFTKVHLAPGEEKIVTIPLNERSFSIYDEKSASFIMPSGNYHVLCASSIRDIRQQTEIHVKGLDYRRNDRELLPSYFPDHTSECKSDFVTPQKDYTFRIPPKEFSLLYGQKLSHFDQEEKGDFNIYHSLGKLSKYSFLGKVLLRISDVIVFFVFKGKSKRHPEVMMMRQGIREGTLESIICQSGGIIPYRFAESIVLSANGKHSKAFKKLFTSK